LRHSPTTDLSSQKLFVTRAKKTYNVDTLVEEYSIALIIRKIRVLSTHWNFVENRGHFLMLLRQMYELYPESKYPEYYL